jgi:hypothetical protein
VRSGVSIIPTIEVEGSGSMCDILCRGDSSDTSLGGRGSVGYRDPALRYEVVAFVTVEESSCDYFGVRAKFLITSYNARVGGFSSLFCFRIFSQLCNVCFVNRMHCFLLVLTCLLLVDFLLRAGRFRILVGTLIWCLRAPSLAILVDCLGADAGTSCISRNMIWFSPDTRTK